MEEKYFGEVGGTAEKFSCTSLMVGQIIDTINECILSNECFKAELLFAPGKKFRLKTFKCDEEGRIQG